VNRRGFLQLASGLFVAPAVVKVDNIMRVVPVETTFIIEQYTLGMDFAETKLGDVIVFRRPIPYKVPIATVLFQPPRPCYIDTPIAIGPRSSIDAMRAEVLRVFEEPPMLKVLQGHIQ
jgi:hypothetical protein